MNCWDCFDQPHLPFPGFFSRISSVETWSPQAKRCNSECGSGEPENHQTTRNDVDLAMKLISFSIQELYKQQRVLTEAYVMHGILG